MATIRILERSIKDDGENKMCQTKMNSHGISSVDYCLVDKNHDQG